MKTLAFIMFGAVVAERLVIAVVLAHRDRDQCRYAPPLHDQTRQCTGSNRNSQRTKSLPCFAETDLILALQVPIAAISLQHR
jgi:hypothetical protein